jgi:hypothetical protein
MVMKNPLSGWYIASIPAPLIDGYYNGWSDCIIWCRDTFNITFTSTIDKKYNPLAGNGWRYMSEGVFEFKEEKDYMMFMLRWA